MSSEAEGVRRRAERALRWARVISDDRAASALNALAADLHKQAEGLEQQDIRRRSQTLSSNPHNSNSRVSHLRSRGDKALFALQ
jgi:hypothetical protein